MTISFIIAKDNIIIITRASFQLPLGEKLNEDSVTLPARSSEQKDSR